MTRSDIKGIQFLMRDFLRRSPWKIFGLFLVHCEFVVQTVNTMVFQIRVWCCFLERKIVLSHFVFFPMKSEMTATLWT